MAIAYLLLGSNMGDKVSFLHKAVERLQQLSINPAVVSSIYESEPWGFNSKEWFLNQAVKIETDLDPQTLLDKILEIEKNLGRKRNPRGEWNVGSNAGSNVGSDTGSEGDLGYSSRTIDIDILLYEDLVINTADLKVPHPRMHLRRFVLMPLCEIAPDQIHPVLNQKISGLLEKCEDSAKVHSLHV